MPTGGGTTRTVSTQQLAPEQKELLRIIMPNVKDYANTPLQMFPGSTVALPTELQQAARTNLADTAANVVSPLSRHSIDVAKAFASGGGAAGAAGAENLLQAGQFGTAGLGELLSGYLGGQQGRQFLESGALLDPRTNPVLGAQTEAALGPITERLTESVLPNIRGDFVGSNMFGSSRQGIAEGRAVNDFLRQAGDIVTELQANNFNQGLGAMLSALNAGTAAASSATGQGLSAGGQGSNQLLNAALQSLSLSPNLAQLAFMPGMTMEGIGQLGQNTQQQLISEAANRFTTQQMLPFLQAQDIANLAFGIGGGSATTTAQQNAAFDPIGTGLGLLMLPRLLGLSIF